MKSNILEKSLVLLGLSELSTKLYIYLLENSKQSITEIAKHFNLHRNYIYNSLEELQSFGLLEYQKDFSKNIILESPEKVLNLIEIKKNDFENAQKNFTEVLPNYLHNFYHDQNSQTVRIYKGRNEFLALLNKLYSQPQSEILVFGNDDLLIDVLGGLTDTFIQKRVKNKSKVRILTTSPALYLERNKDKNSSQFREFRYLPDKISFSGSFHVMGELFISWNPLIPNAVVIEDGVAASMYRNVFELLWEGSRKC